MSNKEFTEFFHLCNRSATLQNLLSGRPPNVRDRDVAHQYNILRLDVKGLVNDPRFDRVVSPAWCLRPLVHIPVGILALALLAGALWQIISLNWALTFAITVVILAIVVFSIPSYPDNRHFKRKNTRTYWFLASTRQQVADKLILLQRYLEDYAEVHYSTHQLRFLPNSQNSLEAEIRHLKQLNFELEQGLESGTYDFESIYLVEQICNRFHLVAKQLLIRRENRETLTINDEYDVQDLLHALLRLHFDDVRPEEWTPSYAGKSSRVDFLLKNETVVIEVKKTRNGLADKQIGDQLIIDIERYHKHPSCNTLVCLIYDPEERIQNPAELENDLGRTSRSLEVKVLVIPKRY